MARASGIYRIQMHKSCFVFLTCVLMRHWMVLPCCNCWRYLSRCSTLSLDRMSLAKIFWNIDFNTLVSFALHRLFIHTIKPFRKYRECAARIFVLRLIWMGEINSAVNHCVDNTFRYLFHSSVLKTICQIHLCSVSVLWRVRVHNRIVNRMENTRDLNSLQRCRLCGVSGHHKIDIFDENSRPSNRCFKLNEKIFRCVEVRVNAFWHF